MPKIINKSKLASNPTFLVFASLIILALGYVTYPLLNTQPSKINEVANIDAVSLLFSPSKISKPANTPENIVLQIDTGTIPVSGAQVIIDYVPGKCLPPVVTQGDFFDEVYTPPKIANGKIKFAFGVDPTTTGKAGTGVIANIQTGPTTNSCPLKISNESIVTMTGSSANLLAKVNESVIELISNASPAPSTPSNLPGSCPKGYSINKCKTYLFNKIQNCLKTHNLQYCMSNL